MSADTTEALIGWVLGGVLFGAGMFFAIRACLLYLDRIFDACPSVSPEAGTDGELSPGRPSHSLSGSGSSPKSFAKHHNKLRRQRLRNDVRDFYRHGRTP